MSERKLTGIEVTVRHSDGLQVQYVFGEGTEGSFSADHATGESTLVLSTFGEVEVCSRQQRNSLEDIVRNRPWRSE